jgi:hypothetical protein
MWCKPEGQQPHRTQRVDGYEEHPCPRQDPPLPNPNPGPLPYTPNHLIELDAKEACKLARALDQIELVEQLQRGLHPNPQVLQGLPPANSSRRGARAFCQRAVIHRCPADY